MHRKNLGKGLSDLLQTHNLDRSTEIQNIPVEEIKPNSLQPRKNFNEQQLQELSSSIKDNGIIQPIIVTQKDKHFEIVVGERRWRACKMLNLKSIPAIIKDISSYKLLEVALIENIQRQDLNAIEEAISYRELLNQAKITQEDLGAKIGKTRTVITNTLRLLKLPETIQQLIIEKQISKGHARTLLALNNLDVYVERVKDCILQWNLSVRQTEEFCHLINKLEESQSSIKPINIENALIQLFPSRQAIKKNKLNPVSSKYAHHNGEDIQKLKLFQIELNEYLDSHIHIKPKKGKKEGTIQIQYKNQQDLKRIVQLIHLQTNTDFSGSI